MVEREDLEALILDVDRPKTLAEWADKYLRPPGGKKGMRSRRGMSAADLVIEQRRLRGDKLFEDLIRRRSKNSK